MGPFDNQSTAALQRIVTRAKLSRCRERGAYRLHTFVKDAMRRVHFPLVLQAELEFDESNDMARDDTRRPGKGYRNFASLAG
jgi:hypothetical protein